MKNLVTTLALCLLTQSAFATEKATQVLTQEWQRLTSLAASLEPDNMVGGYYSEKKYGELSLLWRFDKECEKRAIGENCTGSLRLYRLRPDGTAFAVSYYVNRAIVPGRLVLRRFVGPDVSGWRNDTVDLQDGTYYGRQGLKTPFLTPEDQKILEEWDITLFE